MHRGWVGNSLASCMLGRLVSRLSVMQEALSWAQEPGVMDSSVQRHIQTVLRSTSVPHSGIFVSFPTATGVHVQPNS